MGGVSEKGCSGSSFLGLPNVDEHITRSGVFNVRTPGEERAHRNIHAGVLDPNVQPGFGIVITQVLRLRAALQSCR